MDDRAQVERAIIGCMALEGRATDFFVSEGGNADWFTDMECRTAVEEVLALHAKGVEADLLILGQNTKLPDGWWDERAYETPTATNVEHYTTLLTNHMTREKIELLVKQAENKLAHGAEADALVSWLDSAIMNVVMRKPKVERTVQESASAWLERMTAPPEERFLLDWPVPTITQQLGKVDKELIWISSLPSCGKTAWALQWGRVLAEQRIISSMLSLESGMNSMASRVIAQFGQMNTIPIRQGRADEAMIKKAEDVIANLPPEMRVHHDSMNIDQIRSWAKAEKRKGSRLLMIDNTRHIHVPNAATRVDGMAEMSLKLKQVRDETELPTVVFHHSKLDQNGKEDVSWSSDIRRDTDMLIFLKELPDAMNACGELSNCVLFDLQKQREGEKYAQITMEFKKCFQTFKSWI